MMVGYLVLAVPILAAAPSLVVGVAYRLAAVPSLVVGVAYRLAAAVAYPHLA